VHIPFKLLGDAFPEMLGGRVHIYLFPLPAAMPMLKDGKLRPLAVTAPKRAVALPEVPTMAEAGLPAFDYTLWNGLLGPAKMPRDVKDKLAKEVARILALQDVKERLLTQGATPNSTTPGEFDAFIKNEIARMAKVIKDAGIKAQ
jgi:tripartite-type tricarboxylate transporter receptor subunit TctC